MNKNEKKSKNINQSAVNPNNKHDLKGQLQYLNLQKSSPLEESKPKPKLIEKIKNHLQKIFKPAGNVPRKRNRVFQNNQLQQTN